MTARKFIYDLDVNKGLVQSGSIAALLATDIPDLSATYQPLDSDLTTIAGLTATTDNFMVSVASAWASRTPTQVKTTLGLGTGATLVTDTDGTLAANSDSNVATQKATKTYVDAHTTTAANPSASVGTSAVNGSAATFLRSDGSPALDVGIAPTWTGSHTFSQAIAAALTPEVTLKTSTAATNGNQKWSGALVLTGNGFGGSTSQAVDYAILTQPVQDVTNPIGNLSIRYQVNGGGYNEVFKLAGVSGAPTLANLTLYGKLIPNGSTSTYTLGTSAAGWGAAYVTALGFIDFGGGDVTVTHATNALAFAGASSGYSFDAEILPTTDDGAALGDPTHEFSDLFLAPGGVINWNNGNYTITHSAGTLTIGGASTSTDLKGKQITAGIWSPEPYGFPLAYGSTTTVVVGFPNANAPASLTRDKADGDFIALAGGTTYTISTATNGAVLGDDSFAGAGTVAFNNGTTITGTSTVFKTAFGTRTLTGTSAVTAGTALVGTGTKYLSEVAVNDLVGNATGGWARVTAIASDTALTLSQSLTLTSTCTVIEQPTITLTNDTAAGGTTHQVDKISSDTSLLITEVTSGGNLSGKAYQIGRHYARAAVSAAQFGFIHLVKGATGTSAVISTQRTTTFAQAFGGSSGITGYLASYRRIGSCLFDSSGNILAFSQDGLNSRRAYYYVFAENTNGVRVVNGGAATAWTDVACNVVAPPTTKRITVLLASTTAGNEVYIRPRGINAYASISSTPRTHGDTSNIGTNGWQICPDGAQYIQYTNFAGGSAGYVEVYGYEEDI